MPIPHSSNNTHLPKWKKGIFHLLTIILTFAVSMFLAEMILRLMVHYNLYGENNGFAIFMKQNEINTKNVFKSIEKTNLFRLCDDSDIGWEPIPGVSVGNIKINAVGFRGDNLEIETKSDRTRVVFLGDSETFGLLLKKNQTLPEYLEYFLNTYSGKERFDVLNFGVPGYNTAQEFALLKKKAIRYNPSIVVLYYVLNDPLIANPTILIGDGFLSSSYLYLSIVYLIKSFTTLDEINEDSQSLNELYQKLHSSEYFTSVKSLIRDIGDYLERRNIKFILVIAPEVIGFKNWQDYPYYNIHEKLKNLANANIKVIDPLQQLASSGHAPKKFWVTSYDCHKNAQANKIIGAYLAKQILSSIIP